MSPEIIGSAQLERRERGEIVGSDRRGRFRFGKRFLWGNGREFEGFFCLKERDHAENEVGRVNVTTFVLK